MDTSLLTLLLASLLFHLGVSALEAMQLGLLGWHPEGSDSEARPFSKGFRGALPMCLPIPSQDRLQRSPGGWGPTLGGGPCQVSVSPLQLKGLGHFGKDGWELEVPLLVRTRPSAFDRGVLCIGASTVV